MNWVYCVVLTHLRLKIGLTLLDLVGTYRCVKRLVAKLKGYSLSTPADSSLKSTNLAIMCKADLRLKLLVIHSLFLLNNMMSIDVEAITEANGLDKMVLKLGQKIT